MRGILYAALFTGLGTLFTGVLIFTSDSAVSHAAAIDCGWLLGITVALLLVGWVIHPDHSNSTKKPH